MLNRHALTLVLLDRFSNRLYIAYCVFYTVGELLAMQIPFVGYQPVGTSEHMAAFGVFGLLQVGIVDKRAACTNAIADYGRAALHARSRHQAAIFRPFRERLLVHGRVWRSRNRFPHLYRCVEPAAAA